MNGMVPVLKHGRALGAIAIDSDRPAAFGDGNRRLVERVARALAARMHGQEPTP